MKLERRTASLYVQNTGCQQCPPGYGWGPGVRDHFLLHHVISGKGVYECRDRRYELAAGDTFLVYPNTAIHYRADEEQPWEYVWVGFGGLDAGGFMERTDFTPDEPVYRGRDSEALRALLEAVYVGYGTQTWEQLTMTARLYDLLSFLVRKAAHMGVFFVLTGLLLFALWRLGTSPRTQAGLSLGLCALLAGLDEFHQTFVPGRDGKLPDVLIDLGGGVCFLLLWLLLRHLRGRKARAGK